LFDRKGGQMERKVVLKWEMFGILFISLAGSLLHFAFELSGFWKPLAVIGAVNESVWEHLKIGFWPAFIWGIVEFFVFGRKIKNFFFAKAVTFLLIPSIIVILFYSYTYKTGTEILAVDITIFFIAIAAAQIIGYRIMLVRKRFLSLKVIGAVIIIVCLVSFSLLSYFPPRYQLFRDAVTGGYGIIGESNH
jgi:hypothetical protein